MWRLDESLLTKPGLLSASPPSTASEAARECQGAEILLFGGDSFLYKCLNSISI